MKLSNYIDHTILKPDCTNQQITRLCEEAIEFDFATVCIPPNYVSLANNLLKDKKVGVCTVIGFPLGYSTTATKVFETNAAIINGADEIDMVIQVNQVKSKNWNAVFSDIKAVHEITTDSNKILKVIVETCLLSIEEKKKVYDICNQINVEFVKTSTGFSNLGATIDDILLMKSCILPTIKIKASGGIRTKQFALELIEAGAHRLGCSSSLKIINS